MTAPPDATAPPSSFLDRLVCEVPYDEPAPGFRWYELPLDGAAPAAPYRPPWVPPSARVIVATQLQDADAAWARVQAALRAEAFSCVLFESLTPAHTRRVIAAVHARGLTSIATRHLPPGRYTAAQLVDALRAMEDCGAQIVKVAYRATTPSEVATCLEALERASGALTAPVSITPMGTRWGRIAAAAAGSRLVFAPLRGAADRQSAGDMLRTLESLRDGA